MSGRPIKRTLRGHAYHEAWATSPVRAADISATLAKFVPADHDQATKLGPQRAASVVNYEYVTTRPIHDDLTSALTALQSDFDVPARVSDQAETIRRAIALPEAQVSDFMKQLS